MNEIETERKRDSYKLITGEHILLLVTSLIFYLLFISLISLCLLVTSSQDFRFLLFPFYFSFQDRISCYIFSQPKSFYYKEIQKEKKETGKVERALAIPDLMLGRYTVSLPTFPLHSYEP